MKTIETGEQQVRCKVQKVSLKGCVENGSEGAEGPGSPRGRPCHHPVSIGGDSSSGD